MRQPVRNILTPPKCAFNMMFTPTKVQPHIKTSSRTLTLDLCIYSHHDVLPDAVKMSKRPIARRVQWRQCSYFRRLRAQWMRPGSSSAEISLHYDALATEPTGVQWRQCSYFRRLRAQWMRPGPSSVEINLHYDALTSADAWAQWMLPGSNVEINPIESGWSPQSRLRCSCFRRLVAFLDWSGEEPSVVEV